MKLKLGFLLIAVMLLTGFSHSLPSISLEGIMGIVNADRQSQGLPELSLNPTLNRAALAKAEDMISNHYFAHTSPEGVAPWYWIKTLGYNYSFAGENLAIGYQNTSELVDSWMDSPAHRANILSPNYEDMGLAVIKSQNSTLVVQMFGSPHKLTQK
ncbi:MAG: CAP domain-containing protein [Candidatus Doudnabacteria bacterium]|nr:CAP domain-containing protein [Candidatus Doudnabacteria bacterium]